MCWHLVNICLAPRCSHLHAGPSSQQKALAVLPFSIPIWGSQHQARRLLEKLQVVVTAPPKTNGLWLAAVTNSLIIDFMILRLKLLFNNTQKCLMGSIQRHKNYLLNMHFKTINLLFSINNGSPKNQRQLNVITAFLRGKKRPFSSRNTAAEPCGCLLSGPAERPRLDLLHP